MVQIKEQHETPGKKTNQMEISNLSYKEFKVTVIKLRIELRRKVDESGEVICEEIIKGLEDLKNKDLEL